MHQGVRGFNDRAAIQLRSGFNSLVQPTNQNDLTEYMLPFHTNSMTTSAMCMSAPAMAYPSDMLILNGGRLDSWNTGRAPGMGMAYWNRTDLPYYYTLYESFAAGDAYHQSTFTCTDPNRLHLFSGSNGLSVGKPAVLDNTEPVPGWSWPTMGEILEDNGISWKVYEEADNFDDNGFSWFNSFQKSKPGDPLWEKGQKRSVDLIEDLRSDMAAGNLPQVSWIVGPANVSEHATWHPSAGEDFTARILKVIQSFPDIYAKSVVILNYDEGGQFVDHVWPPTPPITQPGDGMSTVETTGEIVLGITPNGLGFRVPLLVISPWSRGNIVVSETFDHTSVIKFIEKKFNVSCPNISPWRRAVTGDLTSALNFNNPPDYSWPVLPDTSGYVQQAQQECDTLPAPAVPKEQSFPQQEKGTRISRALPYEFLVSDEVTSTTFAITINNTGTGGAAFQMIDAPNLKTRSPRKYAVEGGKSIVDAPQPIDAGYYSFSLYGPNGFVRQFAGDSINAPSGISAKMTYDIASTSVVLALTAGTSAASFTISDNAYGNSAALVPVAAGQTLNWKLDVSSSGQWYDLTVTEQPTVVASTFQRRFMGRLEIGKDSISDPAMGAGIPQNSGRPIFGLNLTTPVSARWQDHPEVPESHRSWPREESEDKDGKWLYNLGVGGDAA